MISVYAHRSKQLYLYHDQSELYNRLKEDQKHFIDLLESLNIEAWYPTYKETLIRSLYVNRDQIKRYVEDVII